MSLEKYFDARTKTLNEIHSGKQGLAKRETCGWQNTNLMTMAHRHAWELGNGGKSYAFYRFS